ncbi:uncharacterized protein LOC135127355 [Zophobas morio]|uniref:uncharacterized protein LOC135127355 n=1 Tax=Zophobas morio TaxID=2755281 RepID=UPI003083C6F6
MQDQKTQKIFRMQPILCPWITSQPYHSSLWSKNRSSNPSDPSLANRFLNNPWINRQMPLGMPRSQDKPLPSIQQSSSQFFYFLRLMQLFPDTHPATLHTVLVLCKNDFFCAVDKMLYAKRCKLLCYKKNILQKSQRGSRSYAGNDTVGMRANNKSEFPKQTNFVNKASSSVSNAEKKREDSTFGVSLHQGASNESLVITSFVEKPEDLTTVKKSEDTLKVTQ